WSFFFSSRRRHTRFSRDWSSDVCSSDLTPPPLTNEAESVEAMQFALAQTYFHWGVHAWAMYALVGGAVAYVGYRRGRTLLMSSKIGRASCRARVQSAVAAASGPDRHYAE